MERKGTVKQKQGEKKREICIELWNSRHTIEGTRNEAKSGSADYSFRGVPAGRKSKPFQ